jgi:4-hydroxy-3-polyprenylbenzoate decarboxylase
MSKRLPVVMAITGASGAPYAVRLLEQLVLGEQPVWLIISPHGWRLLELESGLGTEAQLKGRIGASEWERQVMIFDDGDRGASPASGSALSAGMVICPCSMGTLSAIAIGSSRSLIERAADVALKERRKLVLVPRETPLSRIHLESMLRATEAGAIIMPASPGFYRLPTRIEDLVEFVGASVLDHVQIRHD